MMYLRDRCPEDNNKPVRVCSSVNRDVKEVCFRGPHGEIISEGSTAVSVEPFSSCSCEKLDLSWIDPYEHHLYYYLKQGGQSGSVLFVPPKLYHFDDPELEVAVNEAGGTVTVTAKAVVKGVESYGDDDSFSEDSTKYTHLHQLMSADGITPLSAYCYLLFILLYFPCIAALAAIKREAGWKWVAFEVVYTTGVAWLVSFIFYQIATRL